MLTVSVVKVGCTQVFMRDDIGPMQTLAGIEAAGHIRIRSVTGRIAMQLSALHTSFRMYLAAALLAGAALGPSAAAAENIGSDHPHLARDVSAGEGAFRHLQMLQEIAMVNGGNR